MVVSLVCNTVATITWHYKTWNYDKIYNTNRQLCTL